MPSLEPAAGADAPGDGAPTFSEVLSLSSPDLPSPSGTSAPSPPPPDRDGTHGQMDTAPTTVPEQSPPDRAGSTGRRGHRQADPSGTRERHGREVGSPDAPVTDRSGATGAVSAASGSHDGTGRDQWLGARGERGRARSRSCPPPRRRPSPTVPTPAVPATSAAVATPGSTGTGGIDATTRLVSTLPEDGPAQASDVTLHRRPVERRNVGDGSSGRSHRVGPERHREQSHPNRPDSGRGRLARYGPVRVSADRAVPLGSNAFHVGSEPGPGDRIILGRPGIGAEQRWCGYRRHRDRTPTGEAPELAEFPERGAGTAAPTLDIGDLAATISRPLAGGSGEYSVQVSLHPPELGEVRALLSLQGDVLHVTLTPEHPSGFDALSDAMPALHEQLARRRRRGQRDFGATG